MQQYRVENLDNQGAKINYSKKIKDVEPIEAYGRVLTRETLKDFIEEPCLDACRLLYDMNIQTHMSSANKKDVLYGRWSYDKIVEHIKECYGTDIEIDEELVKDTGFYYCAEDDVYFQSEELLNKHLEYKRREIHPEK